MRILQGSRRQSVCLILRGYKQITLICRYVQHKILEHRETVWDFLQRDGHIFVAGNAKLMPQEVREAFVKVCQMSGGMTVEGAEKFIATMEKQNKYQTECWS